MGRGWRRWRSYNRWDDDYGAGGSRRKKTSSKKKRQSSGNNRRNWAFNSYLPHIPDLSFAMSQFSSNVVTDVPVAASQIEIVIDDDLGDDELDHEVLLCTLRGDIVGIRYYNGQVNNKEMVSLVREPNNVYDRNAVKVTNILGEQVGHIKRELARPLALIMDQGLARVEGVVPFGTRNVYSMPVDLFFYGRLEKKAETMQHLKRFGYYPIEASINITPTLSKSPGSSQEVSSPGMGMMSSSVYQPNRTVVSQINVKNELDKLFEHLHVFDKSTEMEPSDAICTKLFPHQKKALSWMTKRENEDVLPPFWTKNTRGFYYNKLANFETNQRPSRVSGGILADDMGLGKTLQTIALIVTNFKDGKPLAKQVTGKLRQSKVAKKIRLETYRSSFVEDCYDAPAPKPTKRKRVSINLDQACGYKFVTSGKIDDGKNEQGVFTDEAEMSETESEAESETPECSQSSLPASTMLQKDDPDFSPGISKLKKSQSAPVASSPVISSPIASHRPRRSAKKPARYTYSSDEGEQEQEEIPKKRGRRNSTALSKAVDLNPNIIPNEASKGKDKGKGLGKKSKKAAENKENSECPPLPQLNSDSSVPYIVLAEDELPALDGPEVELCGAMIKSSQKISAMKGPPLPSLTVLSGKTTTTPCTSSILLEDQLPELDGPDIQIFAEAGSHIKATGRTPSTGPRATLIVCPLSVLSNWLDQFEEHIHENVHLQVYLYYGNQRNQSPKFLTEQDVVITTYQTLAYEAKGNKKSALGNVEWLRIVLDEGHTIRNPNAQQTKAIMALNTQRRWVLTGTPIQNSLKDLYSLISFLRLQPLGQKEYWNRLIERPVMVEKDPEAIKRVQSLMAAIALRRMKKQIVDGKAIVELPDKRILIEHVKLTQDERKLYETMQKEGRLIVTRYCQNDDLLNHYGEVLAILMRLRQICCHPFLVAKVTQAIKETLESAPNDATPGDLKKTLIEKIVMVLNSGSDEECPICLDPLKSPVITHCAHLFCRHCIEEVIDNEQPTSRCPLCRGDIAKNKLVEVPPESEQQNQADEAIMDKLEGPWQGSAKTDALMNAMINMRVEDGSVKCVIVSQFTSYLTILERPLRENGFKFVRLDGSMSSKQRISSIEAFSDNNPAAPTVMLMSLKAGGVGINLTAASRLFLMDPAWNPASEDQCFDRLHRLGQKKEVVITKFVVEDSVEEKMLELQERKRQLMLGAFGQKKETADQRRTNRIRDIKNLMDL